MRIGEFQIFKEKAGVVSENPCWVALYPGYLYIEDTLFELLYCLLTEWNDDKHLAG